MINAVISSCRVCHQYTAQASGHVFIQDIYYNTAPVRCTLSHIFSVMTHMSSSYSYTQNHATIAHVHVAEAHLFAHRHDEYGDTLYVEERCFITDFASPDHCLNVDPPCADGDVLSFGNRIRRDLELTATFDGWFDPDPDSDIAKGSGNWRTIINC